MRICILNSFGDLMLKDTGTSVRIYNLAKYLARAGHDVEVIVPDTVNWTKSVDGMRVHGISGILPATGLRVLGRLLGVLRYTSLLFYDFLFISRAGRIIQRCDVVQIEQQSSGGFLIPFLTRVFRKPLVVDCHDVFQALRIGHTGTVRRMLETFLEKMAYRFASLVLTVSQGEKHLLTSRGIRQDKIEVIPNGVDAQFFKPERNVARVRRLYGLSDSFTVIFVGNAEYLPNYEAVQAIASEIAPKVAKDIENVKFLVVGRPPEKTRAFDSSNLMFTGVVDNVADLISASDVAVAPLFQGSGTRLKILEYFSCGLPVVSTSVGVEGLEVKDGKNVLIEDDMGEFAARLVDLSKDKEFSMRLGRAAREFVVKNYDWQKIVARLNEVYPKLAKPV